MYAEFTRCAENNFWNVKVRAMRNDGETRSKRAVSFN